MSSEVHRCRRHVRSVPVIRARVTDRHARRDNMCRARCMDKLISTTCDLNLVKVPSQLHPGNRYTTKLSISVQVSHHTVTERSTDVAFPVAQVDASDHLLFWRTSPVLRANTERAQKPPPHSRVISLRPPHHTQSR